MGSKMIAALRAMSQVSAMIKSTTNEDRYRRLSDHHLASWLHLDDEHDAEETHKSLGRGIEAHKSEFFIMSTSDEGLLMRW